MDVYSIIVGFLGGGLFTAVVFVMGYSNKLTSIMKGQEAIEKEQKTLAEAFRDHVKTQQPICQYHQELFGKVSKLEGASESR